MIGKLVNRKCKVLFTDVESVNEGLFSLTQPDLSVFLLIFQSCNRLVKRMPQKSSSLM